GHIDHNGTITLWGAEAAAALGLIPTAEEMEEADEVREYAHAPQNPGFKTGGPASTAGQKKILDSSFNRINQDDCKNFINQTLADYKVGKGFNTLDKLLGRATFGYYDVN